MPWRRVTGQELVEPRQLFASQIELLPLRGTKAKEEYHVHHCHRPLAGRLVEIEISQGFFAGSVYMFC